jgi:hypothetical protein
MVQDLTRQHLLEEIAVVEDHLAMGDIHIADQRKRIAWQDRTGRNSGGSRELLATFTRVRASHLSHHDRLVCQLGEHMGVRRSQARK